MKNITVTVPEDIYRRARIRAAERDTSVSALVKGFLVELASEEPDARRLEREERELRAHIRTFTAGNRLSRDDAHGRGE
jgi:plasmid stability protein